MALGIAVLTAALPAGAATPEPSGLIVFTRIAYAVGVDGPVGSAIYTVDVRTRRARRFTDPPSGAFDSEPAWSPDRRRIAYARARFAGFAGQVEILVADMRGRVLRRVRSISLPSPPRGWAGPAWSPDGSHLAFSNGGVVAAVDINGGPDSLFGIGMFWGIDWSPDGREIAAAGWSTASGSSSSLHILGPGDERRVLRGAWPTGLDWTRRGILFNTGGSLAIVRADGSGFRDLGFFGLNPSASSDGRWIAYERHASLGRRPIMVASVTGAASRPITRPPRNFADVEPDWRPQG